MKHLVALVAFLMIGTEVQANDVFGTWQSETSDTGAYLHVRVAPCGYDTALTCGQIVKAENATRDDLVGRPIITGMAPDGTNRWSGGQIWAPDDDKTYRSNMALDGDSLKVEGCVAIFCRGQTWTRVN
ncbi:MAG: DUF2147 domain-containing protein [Pseudomonadota bacterium]